MRYLYDVGLLGRMPNFIANSLSNRQFRVRVENHLSDASDQEIGVPRLYFICHFIHFKNQ
jgi:hypothetical protein